MCHGYIDLIWFTRSVAGGRPQEIDARVVIEQDIVTQKDFTVVVGAPGFWSQGRWWDYPLIGNVHTQANLSTAY
jgi:hypothetical protein